MEPIHSQNQKKDFLENHVPKELLFLNGMLAIAYLILLVFGFQRGNTFLYVLLIFGELFHLWQLTTYLYTIWDTTYMPEKDATYTPGVDVFITVAGEPVDVVSETVQAARVMTYPNFKVHILNDGYVAKKNNWQEIELLAEELGVSCITRRIAGGAKAGNINNALRVTSNPFVVIFDADHVPHKDFLLKTMGYFSDPKMGFVQSPQYYKNHDLNIVTQGSWEQQSLFFGAICKGKNRLNATTMCGTNMVLRREALNTVGGMCEESIAEDFATGMFMHEKKWKSVFVPEVLAEGLAPEDFLSYYKQQYRWARGALDVIFRYRLVFRRGLSFAQKIQYLSSVSYFLSGSVVLMNALLPLAFFYFGLIPFKISTMLLAMIFLPYMFLTIYVLQKSTNFNFTFRSLAFSMAGFNIHIKALWSIFIGKKEGFSITSKKKIEGNFMQFVIPQIIYIALVTIGIGIAINRNGFNSSLVTNSAWALLNVSVFIEFIAAAMPRKISRISIPKQMAPAIK